MLRTPSFSPIPAWESHEGIGRHHWFSIIHLSEDSTSSFPPDLPWDESIRNPEGSHRDPLGVLLRKIFPEKKFTMCNLPQWKVSHLVPDWDLCGDMALTFLIQGLLCFQISMALYRTWKPRFVRRNSVPGCGRCLCVNHGERVLSSERLWECFKFYFPHGHEYIVIYERLRF